MKQTATDRPFDERNKDVKNILVFKAVTSILNVPMNIVYLFACAHVCVHVCVCVCVCVQEVLMWLRPQSQMA